MKEALPYLEHARGLLPEKGVIFEQGGLRAEVKVVRGYKRSGDPAIRGVYEFIEQKNGQATRYILTHDTLTIPLVQGAIVEDGNIAKTVGFDGLSEEEKNKKISNIFEGFSSCEAYSKLNGDNETGMHYS